MSMFILPYRESWPLWTVQKHVFEAEGQVWVELDDVPDLRSKRDALQRLLEELRRLEWTLAHDGITGWIVAVARGNLRMRRLMRTIGARLYRSDADYHYYCKRPSQPPLARRPVAVLRAARLRGTA